MASKKSDDKTVILRVETGIPGLDGLIENGIPRTSLNLLSGHCGTGKSTFAMQFLYYGAKEKDEPGVYISLEKDPEEIIENMKRFSWNITDLIKQKKISIIKPDLSKFDTMKKVIEDEVDRIGAKRLVIDPFTLITAYFANVYDARKALADLKRTMKKLDCTALAVSDIPEGNETFSSTGFEEFVVSSVIVLGLLLNRDSNVYVRTLVVRKMEATKHSLKLVPIEISNDGLVAHPESEVF